jgi:putative endonuclease
VRQRGGHWWVYLLRCADGSIYAGCTNDLQRRLLAHARGRVKYTRGRRPVEMRFAEPARGKGRALSREAELKRLPRPVKLALAGCDASHLQPAGTEE